MEGICGGCREDGARERERERGVIDNQELTEGRYVASSTVPPLSVVPAMAWARLGGHKGAQTNICPFQSPSRSFETANPGLVAACTPSEEAVLGRRWALTAWAAGNGEAVGEI